MSSLELVFPGVSTQKREVAFSHTCLLPAQTQDLADEAKAWPATWDLVLGSIAGNLGTTKQDRKFMGLQTQVTSMYVWNSGREM